MQEYAETWLSQRVLRPRTVELYTGLLKRYILPSLGATELSDLSPRTVRAWHAELSRAAKPGAITVAKAYRLLRTICETAVGDELITRNPCKVRGAAVERSPERVTLAIDEVAALSDAIEPRYRAMVLLAAWCGLRLGELMALTRADIGTDGSVRVNKATSELASGERLTGPPKTAAGRRTVAIPPHVVPDIELHLAKFTAPGAGDLVFVGTLGQPVRRASFYTAWQRALKICGLQGTHFHDLRHTGATSAEMSGATTRELMARVGHASPSAALRYQHATEDRDTALAQALSGLVTPSPVVPYLRPSREIRGIRAGEGSQ